MSLLNALKNSTQNFLNEINIQKANLINGSIYLIYDDKYIDKKIFTEKESNDDFMFCVANERIEEIMEFARHQLNVIPKSKLNEIKFNENDIVFVRCNMKNKQLMEKFNKTKLYKNQTEKYKNLEYWWRFIKPKKRKITEFKLAEIYNLFPKEWNRDDLKKNINKTGIY